MGVFGKKPEARSWNGDTASELAERGSSGKDPCLHPYDKRIERNRESDGPGKIKINYSCQACGTDFSETRNV